MNSIHTALFLTRETIMIFPLIVFCFIPVYSQITVSLLSLIKKVVLVTFLVEIVMFIFFLLLFLPNFFPFSTHIQKIPNPHAKKRIPSSTHLRWISCVMP